MALFSKIKQKFIFLSKLNDLFIKKARGRFSWIVIISIFTALLQAVGVVSILPFMSMVMDPSIIHNNHTYLYVYNFFHFTNSRSFILASGFAVLALIVVGNLISAYATWLKISFVWKHNHRLSTGLLKKYLSLPYVYFLNNNTSDLGKNVLYEVGQLTGSFLFPFLRIIAGSAVALVIMIMLFFVNFLMTLIVAGVLSVMYFLIYIKYSKKLRESGREINEENRGRYKLATEALTGIKDIKIFGREKYFLDKYAVHSKNFCKLETWYQVVGQVPKFIMEIIAFGGVVALVLYLMISNYPGKEIIPLVGFFAFAGYRLMPALQEIFNSMTIFRFNKVILDRVHRDMTTGELNIKEGNFSGKRLEPIAFKDKIELVDIHFSYPNVLEATVQDINLSIKKNSSVAIAGSTGSGKTTLVDIILGLLKADKGFIKVDGVEINEQNIKNWQANLGYVPQQIYLSDDTIARNIAFGVLDKDIDMTQVKRVAKMAKLDNFVEKDLPKQYHTMIGERGVRLSGGQRQRIGIARALYHDPEILIFDEATNSLDSMTEKAVIEAIEEVAKLKTMIIIAHRLSTIKNCDIIYLLGKGTVVDRGSYEQLIKKNKQFRNMAQEA